MCVYWSIQSIDFTKLSLEHQISFVSQDLCLPLIPRPGMMQFIRESWVFCHKMRFIQNSKTTPN